MAFTTPYSKKYSEPNFMLNEAKKDIKKLIQQYLKRLGSEKAEKATRNDILQNILTDKMYEMYQQRTNSGGDDKDKRSAWRLWIDKICRNTCTDLSKGKDTTAADGMHAPRVVSGAAANGTGMPAQSQSTNVLLALQQQVCGLSEASQSMDMYIEECFTRMKDLRDRQVAFDRLIQDLQMQLRKAIDAQDVGAPAMTQMPAPAPGSTDRVGAAATGISPAPLPDAVVGSAAESAQIVATAPSSAALPGRPVGWAADAPAPRRTAAAAGSSSGAKAAPEPRIRDNTKMVIGISKHILMLFSVKYNNYHATDFSMETQKNHIRSFCRKFLFDDMHKLIAQDPKRTNMTWENAFWLSLLYKFNDQVNKYMARNPLPYEITTEKQKIEAQADACKSIFLRATENFQIKWGIMGTPGGKEDTFEKEIERISTTFVDLGIACDASKIERPVAVLIKTAKKKACVEPVKKESNGDVTEGENDDKIVWIESDSE